MTLLMVVTSPERVDAIQDALMLVGIVGMTVADVRGHSLQQRHTLRYRGEAQEVAFVPRVEIQIVLPDGQVSDAINEIMEVARFELAGDNRIFVLPIEAAFEIRAESPVESDLV